MSETLGLTVSQWVKLKDWLSANDWNSGPYCQPMSETLGLTASQWELLFFYPGGRYLAAQRSTQGDRTCGLWLRVQAWLPAMSENLGLTASQWVRLYAWPLANERPYFLPRREASRCPTFYTRWPSLLSLTKSATRATGKNKSNVKRDAATIVP